MSKRVRSGKNKKLKAKRRAIRNRYYSPPILPHQQHNFEPIIIWDESAPFGEEEARKVLKEIESQHKNNVPSSTCEQ